MEYTFQWEFSDGYKPTKLRVTAINLKQARWKLLTTIERIELQAATVTASKFQDPTSFWASQRVDDASGMYCRAVHNFSCDMVIDEKGTTLRKFILHTQPIIIPVADVTIISCLDG